MAAYCIDHTLAHLLMSSLGLLFLTITISQAQEYSRTPHGLAYENPMAFAPSAYEFFHPRRGGRHAASGDAPPHAAEARADAVHESLWSVPSSGSGGTGLGAGGVAAVVIGFVSLASVAVVAAYVAVRRRANDLKEAKSNGMVQPDHHA